MKPCPTCRGSGRISRPHMDPELRVISDCETCAGTGRVPLTEAEMEAEGQRSFLEGS